MSEQKAIYYGQVEIIPGIVCDGYILNNETAVLSGRGTADLLDMDHKALRKFAIKGIPVTLKPFWGKDLAVGTNGPIKSPNPLNNKDLAVGTNGPTKSPNLLNDVDLAVRGNSVEVVARNSPHCGRKIVVYSTIAIENLIRTYALALINDGLRKNQLHIGKRAVALSITLIRTALDAAIKESCGFIPEIQKTAQKHYVDAVKLIQELGFTCSVSHDIATKQDITSFLKIPESTLNSFLYKHKDEIKPTRLDIATIHSIGRKATRMNGYHLGQLPATEVAGL